MDSPKSSEQKLEPKPPVSSSPSGSLPAEKLPSATHPVSPLSIPPSVEAPMIKEVQGKVGEASGKATAKDELVCKNSVFKDSEEEAERHKWIESEKAGADLGENAIRQWVKCHWWGYLRARWLEHLQGTKFWVELDRGDFGLIQRLFVQHGALLDRIVDRLKAGQENLDIINWARDFHLDTNAVIDILEALDMNSRRLAHKFDP